MKIKLSVVILGDSEKFEQSFRRAQQLINQGSAIRNFLARLAEDRDAVKNLYWQRYLLTGKVGSLCQAYHHQSWSLGGSFEE